MNEKRKPQVEFMPLPEGAHLEIGTRSEPVPVVGVILDIGGGNRLTFAYTLAEARAIAASILEAADRLDREHSN